MAISQLKVERDDLLQRVKQLEQHNRINQDKIKSLEKKNNDQDKIKSPENKNADRDKLLPNVRKFQED